MKYGSKKSTEKREIDRHNVREKAGRIKNSQANILERDNWALFAQKQYDSDILS